VNIIVKPARFGRYDQQSQPWRRGYDWARHEGPQQGLSVADAADAWGYDIDGDDFAEFGRGIDFAQMEQGVRPA
jgi:hypothetical protein